MLSRVDVRSLGNLLSLPLDDISDGLVVQEIEGLDPVKANMVSSSFARLDGEQYQSSRREMRNIILKIGLEPDFVTTSVKDLRNRLYGYLMPKTEVELTFVDEDGFQVAITGRVESFESPLFTKEPEIDISILCFNPDFYDLGSNIIRANTTSLTDEVLAPYPGTVETGVVLKLYPDRDLTAFSVYHRPPDGSLNTLDFSASLQAGDVVTLSTTPGQKKATLTRAGTDSSILYGVSPYSSWISLWPGDNYLRVYAQGAGVPYTIEYTAKYGGL